MQLDSLIPLSRNASRTEFVAYLSSAFSGSDCVLLHNVGTMPFVPELTAALRELPARLPATRWICWVHDLALGNPDYAALLETPGTHPYAEACPDWEYVAVSGLRTRQVESLLHVPCTLIPNGIDPVFTLQLSPRVAALAETHAWWDADAVLLHPARLLPRKAVETGIHLTQAVRSLGVNLQYIITGADDPHNPAHSVYAHHLKTLAEKLHLTDSVHFLGESLAVGPRELCDIFQIADAVFFPSVREGFGLPVLEAGVFGKPVFCPDCEPLSDLPGAITYAPDTTPSDLACWLIRQLKARDTITARRKILRDYRWPSIYLNYIAPLLERPPILLQP